VTKTKTTNDAQVNTLHNIVTEFVKSVKRFYTLGNILIVIGDFGIYELKQTKDSLFDSI